MKRSNSFEWVVTAILAVITLAFFIALGGNSHNPIDKPWLGDHFTGSLSDWIGVTLVVLSIFWISPLSAVFKFYGSRGEERKNILLPVLSFIIGMALIWAV